MPKKLSEIFNTLATASGVDPNDAALTAILGNASLASIEVPDEISNRLTAPRLTMEAAKANPELKSHFTAQALNGVDAYLEKITSEYGFDETAKSEFKAETNTTKRIALVAAKIKALEAAKVGTTGGEKDKLAKDIETLNGQLATLKESHENEKTQLLAGFEKERINYDLRSMALGYNLNLPDSLPADSKYAAVKALLDGSLTEKGVQIVRKDNALTLQTSAGTDFFDPTTNQKVSVSDFFQKELANKGMLKAASATTQTQQTTQQTQSSQGGGNNKTWHVPVE